MKHGSLKCPHCEMWSDKWKSVKRDTPKEMFDTYTCNCGGESVWFAGAPVLIRADEVDASVEWRGKGVRKKFKIMYPSRYPADPSLSGKQYKSRGMIVMNSGGVFFEVTSDGWYTHIRKLSDVLPMYDVCWKD